jgi:hypothetical protein
MGVASASPATRLSGVVSYDLASSELYLNGGGHRWGFEVTIEYDNIDGSVSSSTGFGISTSYLGGLESHAWGGKLAASDVSVSPSAGMTADSGSSLSPVASFNLTFTPTSHKTVTSDCLTGSERVYTGSLKGSFKLTTGLKGLKLSASHVSFGGDNTVTEFNTCNLAPCQLSSWDASSNPASTAPFATGDTFEEPGVSLSHASIDRVVYLHGPHGLIRLDDYSIKNRAPSFTKSSDTLSVTTSSSGLITGAATLAHGKPASEGPARTCKEDGKEYSLSVVAYNGARYEQSVPFEAHTILTGILKVHPTGAADFQIVTLKKK